MSRGLFHVLEWGASHRIAVSWMLALLVSAGTVGGVVTGAARSTPPLTWHEIDAGRELPQIIAPRIVTVSGVLVDVEAQGLTLRTKGDRIIMIHTDARTRYMRKGKTLLRDQLHPGLQLAVIGQIKLHGPIRARAVSIRGEATRPLLPPRRTAPDEHS